MHLKSKNQLKFAMWGIKHDDMKTVVDISYIYNKNDLVAIVAGLRL